MINGILLKDIEAMTNAERQAEYRRGLALKKAIENTGEKP